MDPWVTRRMVKMGFEREHIKESVTRRSYDRLMSTYLILSTKKPQGKVRPIKVRPFCGLDLNSPRPSPTHKVQPSGRKARVCHFSISLPGNSTPTPSPESSISVS